MLEKPEMRDEDLAACLQDEFGLPVAQIDFLPLGADPNTAVFRVVARDGTPYFLKWRRGVFNDISVELPRFLYDLGIRQVILPLPTTAGRLWAGQGPSSVVLYPFIEGRDGYEVDLSDRHWNELGESIKAIHAADIPPPMKKRIPRETYSPKWRERLLDFVERIEHDAFDDALAAQLALFLKARRVELLRLVERADRLAQRLQAQVPELVLCHSDLHAGNIFIDNDGALYVVDWDDPILAPKERDLMYAGGGQFGAGRAPHEEETLFYQGYGRTQVDFDALAYYRYERIIQDIAIYCEQLLSTTAGGEDRGQSFAYLTSNFQPNGVLAIARKADRAWVDDRPE
jgi:spectinomycin phosphotransferase